MTSLVMRDHFAVSVMRAYTWAGDIWPGVVWPYMRDFREPPAWLGFAMASAAA
jgi:hypothetical protein